MDIHIFPGLGLSPDLHHVFKHKNVRIDGDLSAIADGFSDFLSKQLNADRLKRKIVAPFPYEAGLGFFIQFDAHTRLEGFFFVLTGRYTKTWLRRLESECLDASHDAMVEDDDPSLYVQRIKKALDLT